MTDPGTIVVMIVRGEIYWGESVCNMCACAFHEGQVQVYANFRATGAAGIVDLCGMVVWGVLKEWIVGYDALNANDNSFLLFRSVLISELYCYTYC